MRNETFKNADYPNIKAGNSNLYKCKYTNEELLLKNGNYIFIDFLEGSKKPILKNNQKAFQDGSFWNIYQKVS